ATARRPPTRVFGGNSTAPGCRGRAADDASPSAGAKRLDRAPRCPGPPGTGAAARRSPRARTDPCNREWSAEHTERCKMNQSHSDAHQGENSFGRSCAKLRKRMGLTQRELAALLSLNGQAVGQWE